MFCKQFAIYKIVLCYLKTDIMLDYILIFEQSCKFVMKIVVILIKYIFMFVVII